MHQKYDLKVNKDAKNVSEMYSLDTPKTIQLPENRKIRNAEATKISGGKIYFALNLFTPEEERVLKENNMNNLSVLMELNGNEKLLRVNTQDSYFVPDSLTLGTEHTMKIKLDRTEYESRWSNEIKFVPLEFSECCAWKKSPDIVNDNMKYSVDEMNPRIVTKISDCGYCTIIGTHLFHTTK